MYVCDLVFLSRYMRPEGPWQQWLFLVTRQTSWPTGLTGHSGPLVPGEELFYRVSWIVRVLETERTGFVIGRGFFWSRVVALHHRKFVFYNLLR